MGDGLVVPRQSAVQWANSKGAMVPAYKRARTFDVGPQFGEASLKVSHQRLWTPS